MDYLIFLLGLLMLLVPFFICINLALSLLQFRRKPAVMSYLCGILFEAISIFSFIFEILVRDLTAKIIWDYIQWISTWSIGISIFIFIFQINFKPVPKNLVYSIVIPNGILIIIGLIYPNLLYIHPFLYESLSGFTFLLYDYGIISILFSAEAIVLLSSTIGIGIYYYFNQKQSIIRSQLLVIIIGLSIPYIGVIFSAFNIYIPPIRDISPFTFAIQNLIIYWGLKRRFLFDMVALARSLVFENIHDGVIICDQDQRVVDLNPRMQFLLDLPRSEIVKTPLGKLCKQWPEITSLIQNFPNSDEISSILIEINRQGRNYHFEVNRVDLKDNSHNIVGLFLIFQDITEKKIQQEELEQKIKERTQELSKIHGQLRQIQKLESIGRLAGGIAHDFNNILTSIVGNAELGLTEIDSSNPVAGYFTEITKACNTASRLTKKLLMFSRQQKIDLQILNGNQAIQQLSSILSRLIGEQIKLELNLRASQSNFAADQILLEQIIINLVVNARDAMPKGGTLSISTENIQIDENYNQMHPMASPGEYFMISISDTGIGMSPEVKEHLFEPFFTTKSPEKGTGMGLAIVYGAVQQLHGFILVYSDLGKGTSVKVSFPIVEKATQIQEEIPDTLTQFHGTETILLVEDNEMVNATTQIMLEKLGYKVISFVDPENAYNFMQNKDNYFDLLFTDLILPNMNGKELAKKIRDIRPRTKILYASGYANDIIDHRELSTDGFPFITKPFSLIALGKAVRKALMPNSQENF